MDRIQITHNFRQDPQRSACHVQIQHPSNDNPTGEQVKHHDSAANQTDQ